MHTAPRLTLPLADSSKVADASVMLALMAGRNAGAGVAFIKEGGVSPIPDQDLT